MCGFFCVRVVRCICVHFTAVAVVVAVFFFNDTATTEIYTLSLHDALPISPSVAHAYQRAWFGNSANRVDPIKPKTNRAMTRSNLVPRLNCCHGLNHSCHSSQRIGRTKVTCQINTQGQDTIIEWLPGRRVNRLYRTINRRPKRVPSVVELRCLGSSDGDIKL